MPPRSERHGPQGASRCVTAPRRAGPSDGLTRGNEETVSTVSSPAPRRSSEAVFSWIGSLFTFDWKQFHPAEGTISAAVLYLPLLVLKWLGLEEFWLSFAFAAIFTRATYLAVNDAAGTRTRWSVAFVLVGT